MQRMVAATILLFLLMGGTVLGMRHWPHTPQTTPWQRLTTHCPGPAACWAGVQPARHSPQQAQTALENWPEPLDITAGLSGFNIQWRHPQGYRGYMVFNQVAVVFVEVSFPPQAGGATGVRLGDVVLNHGPPDAYAHGPPGVVTLIYEKELLVVRVASRDATALSPHWPVRQIILLSPYGNTLASYTSRQRQAWRGFGSLGR